MKVITEERLQEIQKSIRKMNATGFQCGRISMIEELIEECKELDTLTVSKLRPMSEAPRNGDRILIKMYNHDTKLYSGVLINIYVHIDEFEKPRLVSEAEGWIPTPEYKLEHCDADGDFIKGV